ncbi:hypothetical protein [Azospirillum sp. sgz302134]
MSNTETDLAGTIAKVITEGNLKLFTQAERIAYYEKVCVTLGLNPLTRPFEYIDLNGRLMLYARKEASEQLRMIHGVSIERVEREVIDDVCYVTAYAKNKAGRTDSDVGAVGLVHPDRFFDDVSNRWRDNPKAGQPLSGEDLANAIMKATTKAKRRVTLSICGLSMLDETEIESVNNAVPASFTDPIPLPQAANTPAPAPSAANAETGPVPSETRPEAQLALIPDADVSEKVVGEVKKFCERLGKTRAWNGALDYVRRQYSGNEQLYAVQRITALRQELEAADAQQTAA